MPKRDPRVDAYIAKSGDFAKPILKHFRKLAHSVCPQVEETIKWNMPTFVHNGIICFMAAFKHHCTLRCWKHSLVTKKYMKQERAGKIVAGLLRLRSRSDLPPDAILRDYIRGAVRLRDGEIKMPRSARSMKKRSVRRSKPSAVTRRDV